MRAIASLVVGVLLGSAISCSDESPSPPPLDEEAPVDPPADVSRAEEPEFLKGRPGRFMKVREPANEGATGAREEIQRLRSIGYLSGSNTARAEGGVTLHKPEHTHPSLRVYNSGHGTEAFLINTEGKVLHRWHRTFEDCWHEDEGPVRTPQSRFFRRVHLYENGDLLAIFEGLGLIKIDRDSELVWALSNGAHHDFEVRANGDILVLTREARVIPRIDPKRPILEDSLTLLTADGELKERLSLVEAFERSTFRRFYESRPLRVGDIFHTNAVRTLDDSSPENSTWYRAGHLLVSMRTLDALALVDPDSKTVVDVWTGTWRKQHDPIPLANGHLLLFDNRGAGTRSRVLEFADPSEAPLWVYDGDEKSPFFTKTCGTAQRLPNGNTLITESDYGRAFEVTPAKEIVWEFHNPARAGPDNAYVATLFEMKSVAFSPKFLDPTR